MLRLSDTTVRLYRRRDGKASYRLRSFLMVDSKVGFSLTAYLREISCRLTGPSGAVVEFEEIGITQELMLKHELNTMAHGFTANGVSEMPKRKEGLGTLRMDYRISFTGHSEEKAQYFEVVVPVVKRGK